MADNNGNQVADLSGNETGKADGKKASLWNFNFFLLWQGQLVSSLGDAIYSMALGFWILDRTGSTALMGSLMAASMIPRIILSPFAGVFVDRFSKKWIIVLTDAARGIAITFVGIAAIFDFVEVWMVFGAAIIMGCCAAFFNPSVSSIIPEIVVKDKLVKANSLYNMASNGASTIGSVSGGFLYMLLQAPLLFLFNGIAYLFSAFTEIFIKIPKGEAKLRDFSFKEDFKEGFRFCWRVKGLRYLIMLICLLNLFSQMGFTLMMPLFKLEAGLGAERYGIAMGTMTVGMFIGMGFLSLYNLKTNKKYITFMVSTLTCFTVLVGAAIFKSFYAICAMFLISGASSAILNTMISSTMQLAIPEDIRGKVFSMGTGLAFSFIPVGSIVSGVLAEFIPLRTVILVSFALQLSFGIILIFIKPLKKFINFNPSINKLEDLTT